MSATTDDLQARPFGWLALLLAATAVAATAVAATAVAATAVTVLTFPLPLQLLRRRLSLPEAFALAFAFAVAFASSFASGVAMLAWGRMTQPDAELERMWDPEIGKSVRFHLLRLDVSEAWH